MAKKKVEIKYPAGWRGVSYTDTLESRQEELFLPTENMLVAVNFAGKFDYGTVVIDLDKKNNIDPDRAARLQSAFRVIKYPLGEEWSAIAIQLGPSGQKDTKAYFCDRLGASLGAEFGASAAGDAPVAVEGKIAVAKGSYFERGPFDCGTGKCEHKIGEDDDGNPISSLHISTKALFRKNDDEDGPLKFESPLPPPNIDLNFRVNVHLSWDKATKKWYWWSTAPMVGTYPLNPHEYQPGTIKPQPADVASVGSRPGEPVKPDPGVRAVPGGVPTYDPVIQNPDGSRIGYPTGPVGQNDLRSGDSPAQGLFFLAAMSPVMAPALGFRPQNYGDGQIDTGMLAPPTSQGAAKATNAPLTGMASAFGAQGGQTAASGGYGPSQTGSQGDPWHYNEQPARSKVPGAKNSRYLGGTANGGMCFHPPETDLRDAAKKAMQPSGVTLSTTYIMVSPGAYFAAGTPQLVSGALKDGYSFGMEASTGDLVFRSHSDSQSPIEALRFTKTAQTIKWKSAGNRYGEFEHLNSSDRLYTFPDTSGVVLVSIASDANGAGGTATLGKVGGSGPTSTAQNGWERIVRNNGATAWAAVWS